MMEGKMPLSFDLDSVLIFLNLVKMDIQKKFPYPDEHVIKLGWKFVEARDVVLKRNPMAGLSMWLTAVAEFWRVEYENLEKQFPQTDGLKKLFEKIPT
jgi:hypothetical protein